MDASRILGVLTLLLGLAVVAWIYRPDTSVVEATAGELVPAALDAEPTPDFSTRPVKPSKADRELAELRSQVVRLERQVARLAQAGSRSEPGASSVAMAELTRKVEVLYKCLIRHLRADHGYSQTAMDGDW